MCFGRPMPLYGAPHWTLFQPRLDRERDLPFAPPLRLTSSFFRIKARYGIRIHQPFAEAVAHYGRAPSSRKVAPRARPGRRLTPERRGGPPGHLYSIL